LDVEANRKTRVVSSSLACILYALFGYLLMRAAISEARAQSCLPRVKEIIYAYAPALCAQTSCMKTQKLVILGSKILQYFKNDFVSDADTDTGFVYLVDKISDVLSDDLQKPGVKYALSQLSPGASYSAYSIRASLEGDALILNDHVVMNLPYVGQMTFTTITTIKMPDCSTCAVDISVETVMPNQSTTTI
jgi:hypothetical protein